MHYRYCDTLKKSFNESEEDPKIRFMKSSGNTKLLTTVCGRQRDILVPRLKLLKFAWF